MYVYHTILIMIVKEFKMVMLITETTTKMMILFIIIILLKGFTDWLLIVHLPYHRGKHVKTTIFSLSSIFLLKF